MHKLMWTIVLLTVLAEVGFRLFKTVDGKVIDSIQHTLKIPTSIPSFQK